MSTSLLKNQGHTKEATSEYVLNNVHWSWLVTQVIISLFSSTKINQSKITESTET